MFNLRLRQAETAFREGRLDEAVELASLSEVREHRDGQRLITKLVTALVRRGQEHFDAGRLESAQHDCELARRFGGNQPEITKLFGTLAEASQERQRQKQRQQKLIGDARGEVESGNCDLGEQIMQRAANDGSSVARLGDEIAVRRGRIEAALDRANQSVESGRTAEAVSRIEELRRVSPGHPDLARLIDQVTGPVVEKVRSEIEAARLDRVGSLLERVRPLVDLDTELDEFDRIVELSRRAAGLLENSRFDEVTVSLRNLSSLLPGTKWVDELIAKTDEAARLASELKATPLSLLDGQPGAVTTSIRPSAAAAEPIHGRVRAAASSGGNRYLLQIDGTGSALLLCGRRVSIGSARQKSRVDLALTGYAEDAVSYIERRGESYRLVAGADAVIDGRPGRDSFLAADSCVSFGNRCRFKFRVPNAAAPSAVLDLDGTRLSRPDIRTVVLFDETMIVGPGKSSHLTGRSLDNPIVLCRRDGEFFVRSGFAGREERRSPGRLQAVPLGESVEVAGSRMLISPVAEV